MISQIIYLPKQEHRANFFAGRSFVPKKRLGHQLLDEQIPLDIQRSSVALQLSVVSLDYAPPRAPIDVHFGPKTTLYKFTTTDRVQCFRRLQERAYGA